MMRAALSPDYWFENGHRPGTQNRHGGKSVSEHMTVCPSFVESRRQHEI